MAHSDANWEEGSSHGAHRGQLATSDRIVRGGLSGCHAGAGPEEEAEEKHAAASGESEGLRLE